MQTPAIKAALAAIDRRDFVRDELLDEAYADGPLPIGRGQTISQPSTVAFMLELLQPQAGHNVLDIGSGSGWQTSLLAYLVSQKAKPADLAGESPKLGGAGHVTALEIIPYLCEWGRQNVAKYNYLKKGIVEMHCQDGRGGYPTRAPFDRIIAAAAGEEVPEAWLAQTKIGGRIVTPVGGAVWQLIKKSETDFERREYPGFAFVPLVGRV